MEEASKFCSVCFGRKTDLIRTGQPNSCDATWFLKLSLCVPQVSWKHDDLICNLCIHQLEIVDAFRKMCLHTDALRKEQENLKNSTQVICFHCNTAFINKPKLISHIQKQHQFNANEHIAQNITYTCNNCRKCYKNPSLFKKHSRLCTKQVISETNASFQTKQETNETTVKQKSSDSFNCFVSTNAKQESPVVQENKETSSEYIHPTVFSCDLCSKEFTAARKLVAHAVAEHNVDAKSIRPYRCDKCESRFAKSTNLQQHKLYHQKSRTNMCSFCGKGFITKNDLRIHEKQHLNKREYKCEFCPKHFNTHKDVRSHKLVVHTDPSKWNHVCSVCGKRFPIKSNYDIHMRRHTGDKRFGCHICEKRFIDKVVLQKHIISHSNVRAFKCDFCEKEYKYKRIRDVHLAQAHGIGNAKVPVRVKKYFCHVCPKSYFAKNKLTRHMCVHTGERPFSCDFCKKTFTDKSYVKQHLKNAHNVCENEGDKC